MTNTNLLEERIKQSGLKKKFIAEKLGRTPEALNAKIRNITEFKSSEVKILCDLLSIKTLEDKEAIFFADKVDYKSTKDEG